MNKKGNLVVVIVLVLVGVAIYLSVPKSPNKNPVTTNPGTSTTTTPKPTEVQYKNSQYNFSINLPTSWKGYTVIEDQWEGDSLDANGHVQVSTVSGPLISIRHPDWEYKSPRQDIPIMVFTIKQWNDMQADKFHVGAAPINPSELGRNAKYVFALPARYNFSYLTGFEEVDQIVHGDNFKAF